MKFTKDVGFVIKRTNYRDADRILTIFTQNSGKIEVLAKGVRKLSSKRASYTELLNLVHFQAVEGRRGLVLTETTLINAFPEKRGTLQYMSAMFYICELMNKLCPHEERNEKVFMLLEGFLSGENGGQTISKFQRGILTHLGYWDNKRMTTSVTELNQYIEHILEKKINSHKYL